jgi:glutamate/tyrosine decarboxylase-like PLP-dependent enzyme
MTPGGSMANTYSLLTARHKKFPEIKSKGLYGLPMMKIFTSAHSHYSMYKAVVTCGFGLDSVVSVKCDSKGKMLVDDLIY